MALQLKLFTCVYNVLFVENICTLHMMLESISRNIPANKPENFRPITILGCLCMLFTSILNNRLTKFLDTFDALNESQAGFRKGYSTVDHIFTLNAIFELLKAYKKTLYCAFIDLSRYSALSGELVFGENYWVTT